MSIRAKVISSFVAVIFLFAGVSYFNYARSTASNERLTLIQDFLLPLSGKVAELNANVQALVEDMRRYYFEGGATGHQSSLSRMARDLYPYIIRRKFRSVEELVKRYRAQISEDAASEVDSLVKVSLARFEELVTAKDVASFQNSHKELRSLFQMISTRIEKITATISISAQSEVKRHLVGSYVLVIIVFLFGTFTVLFSSKVLKPLPQLIESLKKISDGDFGQSLKTTGSEKDEIFQLAREYNRMLAALAERDQKIQSQQKELLQSERLAAVGQLSAEVVHEIRNPLNSLSLNLDWLSEEINQPNPEIQRSIQSMHKEIQRLNDITERYLLRAKVPDQAAGESSNLNELLKEIVEFSYEEHRAQNIEVSVDLSEEEIAVYSDRSSLKQVFLNLLKNAREAMPCGGKLRITTKRSDNTVEVSIADTGHGMNQAVKRQSFVPFYTTKKDGTGLGLMLVKKIIEKCNGVVTCESEVGRGTKFVVRLPLLTREGALG